MNEQRRSVAEAGTDDGGRSASERHGPLGIQAGHMSLESRIILALAGVCGASGVALAAVAAHVAGGTILATAAEFLILHAAAATGLIGVGGQVGRASRLALAAAAALLVGALLFSGDLAVRQLAGTKLLFGTAPLGGSVMILGWLLVVVAAVLAREA